MCLKPRWISETKKLIIKQIKKKLWHYKLWFFVNGPLLFQRHPFQKVGVTACFVWCRWKPKAKSLCLIRPQNTRRNLAQLSCMPNYPRDELSRTHCQETVEICLTRHKKYLYIKQTFLWTQMHHILSIKVHFPLNSGIARQVIRSHFTRLFSCMYLRHNATLGVFEPVPSHFELFCRQSLLGVPILQTVFHTDIVLFHFLIGLS